MNSGTFSCCKSEKGVCENIFKKPYFQTLFLPPSCLKYICDGRGDWQKGQPGHVRDVSCLQMSPFCSAVGVQQNGGFCALVNRRLWTHFSYECVISLAVANWEDANPNSYINSTFRARFCQWDGLQIWVRGSWSGPYSYNVGSLILEPVYIPACPHSYSALIL